MSERLEDQTFKLRKTEMDKPENSQMRALSETLGLGTWSFGGRAYGPMEDQVCLDVVKLAYDEGIRFFNTAHIYAGGRSEELLGMALQGIHDVVVSTQIGYDTSSGNAVPNYDQKFLDQALGLSLKRLRRSQVELLLLHNPPTEILEQQEIFRWLERQVELGKIRRWGVSVYDSMKDAELALAAGASAIEARYSLIRRDVLDGLAHTTSFQFIARSPFDSGLLSGKYSGNELFPRTDLRSTFNPEYISTTRKFLSELQYVIDQGGVSSFAELALRFACYNPRVAMTIPGVKSVRQLQENIDCVKRGPLPNEILKSIDCLRDDFLKILPVQR
jgi:aryl-alcohol dehydrogenase-like predicted oxidoreductase